MTSNYNSNPSNSLVINKAHIVAEGERGEMGGVHFHFNGHMFRKSYWLIEEQRTGSTVKSLQISVHLELNLFLPHQSTQAALCSVFLSPPVHGFHSNFVTF